MTKQLSTLVCLTKTSVSPDFITGKQWSRVKGHGVPETQLSSRLKWTTPRLGQVFEIGKVIKHL